MLLFGNLIFNRMASGGDCNSEDAGGRSAAHDDETSRILMTGTSENLIYQAFVFLGFISEFSKPEVRSAFLRGHFCIPGNSDEMLRSIDLICDMLLPSPKVMIGSGGAAVPLAGVRFFVRLLAEGGDEPTDMAGNFLPVRQSYQQWFSLLSDLSASKFWKNPPSDPVDVRSKMHLQSSSPKEQASFQNKNIGSHFVAPLLPLHCSNSLGKDVKRGAIASKPLKSFLYGKSIDLMEENKYEPRGPNRDDHQESEYKFIQHDQGQQSRTKRQVQRYLPPSRGRHQRYRRDSSSHTSETCVTESSFERSLSPVIRRRHRRDDQRDIGTMLENLRLNKEAIPPGTFSGKDGASLKLFLSDYEKYFATKFDGNERQQAKHLGEYLTGRAKQVYEAVEGSRMKYSNLKDELLDWYRSEKTSSRSRGETEFEKANMSSSDTLKIYALRLERLAAKAYPDSLRERERQLCRKMWSSAPRAFVKVMNESERHISVVSHKKRLDWNMIVKLTEAEERQRKSWENPKSAGGSDEECAVWYSRPGYSREVNLRKGELPNQNNGSSLIGRRDKYGPTVFHNSNRGSPPGRNGGNNRPRSDIPICQWCGRMGHLENSCWAKVGACLICGSSEHDKDRCPSNRYLPQCSNCGGAHLGRDCDQLLN